MGFVSNHDFNDRCIQWAQARKYGKGSVESKFNHTFLMVSPLSLVEAQAGGVVRRDLTEYTLGTAGDFEIWRPPYFTGAGDIAASAMQDLVGRSYGFLTIASEGLCFLTGTKLRFGLSGQEICSGAVSYALTRANINVGDDEAFNSPADVRHVAIQQGWTRVTL